MECKGNVEWEYGENRRGMGRNVKKSHKSRGKTQKTILAGEPKWEKSILRTPAKWFQAGSARIRGTVRHRKRDRRAEPGENTNGSEFPDCSKNKGSNRSGSRQTEETEKKLSKTGETGQTPACFLSVGAGAPCGAKEKHHAGGHDARRAIGHSV